MSLNISFYFPINHQYDFYQNKTVMFTGKEKNVETNK
jgi:hypothetical protein